MQSVGKISITTTEPIVSRNS